MTPEPIIRSVLLTARATFGSACIDDVLGELLAVVSTLPDDTTEESATDAIMSVLMASDIGWWWYDTASLKEQRNIQ